MPKQRSAKMLNLEKLCGGKLKFYQLDNQKNWTARFFTEGKYKTTSLGTDNYKVAKDQAISWYENLRVKQRSRVQELCLKIVTRQKRELQNCVSHKGILIWFTGLSGSGKSTIAHEVESRLFQRRAKTYMLDGDVLRRGISSDLGFSVEDRNEHMRRIGQIAKMFVDAGIITLAAFISPFSKSRDQVRSMFSNQDFIEVYCRCPIVECVRRDVKGLYEKAKSGEIKDFTGISSPYEEPLNPDLLLDTYSQTFEESVNLVISILDKRKIFDKGER